MQKKEEILDVIRKYLQEEIDPDMEVTRETNIVNDLNLDSLDYIALIDMLENTYELTVEEENFHNKPHQIGDIVDLIEQEISNQAS